MPDLSRFRALSDRERALISIGVLLDGLDAVEYLSSDKDRKTALQRAAKDIVALPPDLRIPLLGTMLREAITNLGPNPFVSFSDTTGRMLPPDLSEDR